MNFLRVFQSLGPVDAKSVTRDPLLRWIVILPFMIALAARTVLPVVALRLSEMLQVDLIPHYPAIMSYFLLITPPSLVGFVTGFLLLDQKDDRTLTALQVTPLSLNRYLAYRLAAPMFTSIVVTMLVFPVAGLVEIRAAWLFLASASAAPMAPLFALFLAAFARNKVQGFSLMKASGVLMAPPLIAFFSPPHLELWFGLAPTYWPAKLLWVMLAGRSDFGWYLTAGLVYQLLLLAFLLRRFNSVMTR